ncbi:MAG TPA: winged helix-turn-helix domain-containing protein, partial [Caulobacteraceae bacterium]
MATLARHSDPVRLATLAAFPLGPIEVDPARRRITHLDGRAENLEPRVMQVLVALARAEGRILSRNNLMDSCWPGVLVGEDALNRVIGRVRRLSEGLGSGSFTIETITKVGYRLAFTTADQTRIGAIVHPGARPPLALPDKP